jgi:hypothetical protein
MSPRTREWSPSQTEAELGLLEEFVQFYQAGSVAAGRFRCVACGNEVACVGRLPVCRVCDGGLWERPETSPFAGLVTAAPGEDEAWHEDVAGVARLVHGIWYALGAAAVFWVLLAVAFAYWVTQR